MTRFVRSILSLAVLAIALAVSSVPAFATGGDRGTFGSFAANGFVGFGVFTTAGGALSSANGANGGGVAEAFGDGTAGGNITRDPAGGTQFGVFQTNTTGAQANGAGTRARGWSDGAASGWTVGGNVAVEAGRGTFGRRH